MKFDELTAVCYFTSDLWWLMIVYIHVVVHKLKAGKEFWRATFGESWQRIHFRSDADVQNGRHHKTWEDTDHYQPVFVIMNHHSRVLNKHHNYWSLFTLVIKPSIIIDHHSIFIVLECTGDEAKWSCRVPKNLVPALHNLAVRELATAMECPLAAQGGSTMVDRCWLMLIDWLGVIQSYSFCG